MSSEERTGGTTGEPTNADDDTVVSSRRAPAHDASAPEEETVEAQRTSGTSATTDPVPADADATELSGATSRIRRRRAAADADATVPIRREDDPTRHLTPEAIGEAQGPRFGVKPVMARPVKRRRGDLHPAPVPAGYGERAVRPAGVGTRSTYRARAIPPPPPTPARPATSALRRITDGGRSVTRRSRRFAAVALSGFAVACLVSAGGLVLIAQTAFWR